MARVANSEAKLIQTCREILTSPKQSLVLKKGKSSVKIGPTARKILESTLRKGVFLWLTESGGWQNRAFLKDGVPVRGPVWVRHPNPGLTFGPRSFVIIQNIRDGKGVPKKKKQGLGEEILLFLLHKILPASALRTSPLCHLLWVDSLVYPDSIMIPSFESLIQNDSWVIEALTPLISKRWVDLELSKNKISNTDSMLSIGRTQKAILDQFFSDCDRLGRRDLVTAFVEAASWILGIRENQHPLSNFWTESLSFKGIPLNQRQSIFEAAGAFLHSLSTIQKWTNESSLVSHWDPDEYKVAQMHLSNWSIMTKRNAKTNLTGFERASNLYNEMTSL